jgi:aquaporin Z
MLEGLGVAIFVLAAGVAAVLIEAPDSPLRSRLPDGRTRLLVMGLAMGTTVVALVYSPLGARSGGHFNPAVTLAFFRLGKVRPADAAAYVLAQFAGGVAGTLVAGALLGAAFRDPPVRAVTTVPGAAGAAAAFAAEAAMTFVQMSVILLASNHRRLSSCTGVLAAALVALYITIEAPVSGMSLNPARSFGPALAAGALDSFWIYLLAPPLGMLAAAETFARRRGVRAVLCAKLYHGTAARCIFRCRHDELHP